MVRVAINGFGRIGRAFFRICINDPEVEVVAINDCAEINQLAYLLKYDSVHGKFDSEIRIEGDHLIVKNKKIKVIKGGSLNLFPWKGQDIDVVIEATGKMRKLSEAQKHISSGAKKVLITAIPKNEFMANIPKIIYGINEKKYHGEKVVSAASCSANCAAPIINVLNNAFSIEYGTLTAVHSYTKDQRLLDAVHPNDMRRGRAAALNIVPSESDAAKVIADLIPGLKGKLMGSTIRVPTADGSLMDIVCKVEKPIDEKKVNDLIKNSAENEYKGIIEYSDEPLVSRDTINNPSSAIFDSLSTRVVSPSFLRVAVWFDHEWGYAARVIDIAKHMGAN